ncbi:hypothetical protein D3C86_1277680 [compost metagenome]
MLVLVTVVTPPAIALAARAWFPSASIDRSRALIVDCTSCATSPRENPPAARTKPPTKSSFAPVSATTAVRSPPVAMTSMVPPVLSNVPAAPPRTHNPVPATRINPALVPASVLALKTTPFRPETWPVAPCVNVPPCTKMTVSCPPCNSPLLVTVPGAPMWMARSPLEIVAPA